MSLFNRYLFADYSGAGKDSAATPAIRLWEAETHTAPWRVHRPSAVAGRSLNFSREALRLELRARLDTANAVGERVLLGQDHQYGWPPFLRRLAQIDRLPWRDGVRRLAQGHGALPPLDVPSVYCAAFNAAVGQDAFWSPLPHVCRKYGLSTVRPNQPRQERFRLTEIALPSEGRAQPKPADGVGGRGEGIVGGQTICGLRQIARMLDWPDLAWWPFDGLDIGHAAYEGKHVAIEIYPSALRPAHIPQTDDNDARHSCLYAQEADRHSKLKSLLNLSALAPHHAARVRCEGWIVGMNSREPFA